MSNANAESRRIAEAKIEQQDLFTPVDGKRTRKPARSKDSAYFDSVRVHKSKCHPNGGFLAGTEAGYDRLYRNM